MTTSLGPALAGICSPRARRRSNRHERQERGHKLRQDGARQPRTRPHRKATRGNQEAGLRDPRWAKRASAEPWQGESLATTLQRQGPPRRNCRTGKTAKDDADTGSGQGSVPTPRRPGRDANAASLQDHLPLLIAFHDMRHFSTSAKADGRNTATGETAPDPALDGQPPLRNSAFTVEKVRSASSADADALETMSRSERASTAAGLSRQNSTRQAVEIEPALATRPCIKMIWRSHLLKDQPAADVPAPAGEAVGVGDEGPRRRPVARCGPNPENRPVRRAHRHRHRAELPCAIAKPDEPDGISRDRRASPRTAACGRLLSTPSAASQMASSVAVPTHILKIELHPAELGMVTASLRLCRGTTFD